MIVEGQVHGGIAQGIGQALLEHAVYDKDGQLVSGSLMDYTLPRAHHLPRFEVGLTETKSPSNPLGIKGCGEAGAIAAPAAVINAITDAIGSENISMPATPQIVWAAMQNSKAACKGGGIGGFRCTRSPYSAPDFRAPGGQSAGEECGGEAPRRRAFAHPGDEASARQPVDADRSFQGRGIVGHRAERPLDRHRRDDHAFRGRQFRKWCASNLPALAAVPASIGDPHVRLAGTIGGSIANNDPNADYPAACLGLGATIITSKRKIAADEFFTGMFETALEPDEIITKVSFPLAKKAAYQKFKHPASGFALVGVFVSKRGSDIRVAVTGAGANGVFRVTAFEEALKKRFSPKSLEGMTVPADGPQQRHPCRRGLSRASDRRPGAARGRRRNGARARRHAGICRGNVTVPRPQPLIPA